MCVEYFFGNKKQATIQSELVEIIPLENIVFYKDWGEDNSNPSFEPNSCLCSVNAWATAKKNNMRIVQSSLGYYFGDEACEAEIKWQKEVNKDNTGVFWKDSANTGYNH